MLGINTLRGMGLLGGLAAMSGPIAQATSAPKRRTTRRLDVPYNDGRNEWKRKRKAFVATLKGVPGGWKKAIRLVDADMRRRAVEESQGSAGA